jgi:hypothetical protein
LDQIITQYAAGTIQHPFFQRPIILPHFMGRCHSSASVICLRANNPPSAKSS